MSARALATGGPRWLVLALLVVACTAPQQSDTALAEDADAAPSPDTSLAADEAESATDVVTAPDTPATPPSLCRSAVTKPAWYHDAVGYEVFVRSFQDSDGDGVGDFKGLTSRLDYLNDGKPGGDDLGVTLLWLMPVHDSPSYHGYDVRDYRKLNAAYGTDADFDAFLQAAHARGIRVVLDLVLNHASKQHPWFQASAAGTDKQDWFVWSTTQLSWKQPFGNALSWHKNGNRWFYGVFADSMPDWNFTTPAVTAEMTDVALDWLDRGVDGYRLDAVRYLVETGPGAGQKDTQPTLEWWQAWSKTLRQHQADAGKPEPLLVGEAWASNTIAAKYQVSGGLNMTFDFDLASALLTGLQAGDGGVLGQVLCAEDGLFGPDGARGTFLTNHDMVRIATQLASEPDTRLAAVLLLVLPGTPWLYYGEEIGMQNGDGGDEAKRQPMQWQDGPGVGFTTGQPWQPANADAATVSVAAQRGKPGSLWTLYQKLIGLRQSSDALSHGETRLLGEGALLGVLRQSGGQRVLAVLNLGETAVTPPWNAVQLGSFSQLTDLLTGQQLTATLPQVPAHGFSLLGVQ